MNIGEKRLPEDLFLVLTEIEVERAVLAVPYELKLIDL